jgi:IS30 family transposase
MIKRCTLEKFIYKATRAQRTAEEELAGARCGIAVSEQERLRISEIVSPLIKNGQSPYHICAMNKDALMISDKTLYKYIAANLLDVSSTDLARKVKMKPRRAKPQIKVERACREGRTYRDFENFMSENPDTAAVQMDSVIGSKGTGEKVLLTIHFPASHLMLAFLREANTARSVSEIFNMLKEKLGYEHFTELFPAILTDNGSEFSNPSAIETDEDGVVWTKIFYCDPNCPYQKPQIENNHTLIRKISPKGKSMNFMAQSDADSMMGQINSYARKSLGGKTPLTLFLKMYGKPIAKKLGLRAINTNDITLSPNLFK